jgi:hypothetical protein
VNGCGTETRRVALDPGAEYGQRAAPTRINPRAPRG